MDVAPRKDKGKGKMKYLPELPEEVWQRIWAFYYGQCASEWTTQAGSHHTLTPLLLSPEHTRMAFPVFYAHPIVTYKAIPSFLKAMTTPSIWVADYKPASTLVRHLTICASSPSPAPYPETSPQPAIIHPLLPQVFGSLPRLLTFHLKDTLVLHSVDANTLFTALRLLHPCKARLEFRMWDLIESPFGPDLIAATQPSIHTSMNRSPANAGRNPDGLRDRLAMSDMGRYAMQEQWRDALWRGTELDLPAWWIDIPKTQVNGALAPGVAGGFAGLFPQTQQAQTIAGIMNAHLGAGGVGGAAPGGAGLVYTGWGAGHLVIHGTTGANQPVPVAHHASAPWPVPTQLAGHVVAIPAAAPALQPAAPAGTINPSDLTPPFASDLSGDFEASDFDDSGSEAEADAEAREGFDAMVNRTRRGNEGGAEGFTPRSAGSAQASTSTSAGGSSSIPITAAADEAGSSSDQLGQSSSSSTSLVSQAIPGLSYQPDDPRHTIPSDDSQPQPHPGQARMTRRRAFKSITLGILDSSDEEGDDNNLRPVSVAPHPTAQPSSSSGTTTTPAAPAATSPLQQLGNSIRLRLRTRPAPVIVPAPTLQPAAPIVQQPPYNHTRFQSPGQVSYHLAHTMRRQLLELITQHWSPTIQALSVVAFDPLATLVIRAPSADFWASAPIPHIRVHLPRGINSLAVFKGATENALDSKRNRRESSLTHTPMSDDGTPEVSDEESRQIVGGDGYGGGLVHEETRLFEIEVNTIREMSDEMWDRAGDQLPPQVCRMLVGEAGSDWDGVRWGPGGGSGSTSARGFPNMDEEEVEMDDAQSSVAESDDEDYPMSDFDGMSLDGEDMAESDGEDNGTYDPAAAEEQERRLRERKATRAMAAEAMKE